MSDLVPRTRPAPMMLTCPNCGTREHETRFMWYEPLHLPPDFYCLSCRQKFEQEELHERRMERKKNELVAGVAKLGNGTKAEAATISDLWMELQDQFGGADQFAAFWKQQLMRAASSHKGSGSARVLATCANLAKICAMSSQHEVAKMSVSKMTDKQLADELLGLLRQLPLDQRRRLLEVSEIPDVEYEVK